MTACELLLSRFAIQSLRPPDPLPFLELTVGQGRLADIYEMLHLVLKPDLTQETVSETWNMCAHEDLKITNNDGSKLDPSVFTFDQDDHRLALARSVENSVVGTYGLKL